MRERRKVKGSVTGLNTTRFMLKQQRLCKKTETKEQLLLKRKEKTPLIICREDNTGRKKFCRVAKQTANEIVRETVLCNLFSFHSFIVLVFSRFYFLPCSTSLFTLMYGSSHD